MNVLKGLLVATVLSLFGLSPARADLFTYNVLYTFNGVTVTGDIVLNCDACSVTSASLVSWSLSGLSGTSATFTGSDLSASPTSITFVPTASTSTIFTGISGSFFFGSASVISGGTASCTPGHAGCTTAGILSPCVAVSAPNNYGSCSSGVLTSSSTASPLVIATANFASVPGPVVGAGLPGLILGFAGVGFMAYRRRSQNSGFRVA
jgi:hypothetical protein